MKCLDLDTSWGGGTLLSVSASILLASAVAHAGSSESLDKSSIQNKIIQDVDERVQEKRRLELLNSAKPKEISKIPKYYGTSLYKLLNLKKEDIGYVPENEQIELMVTILFERVKREIQNGSMSAIIDGKGKSTVYDANSKKLTKEDIKKHNQDIVQESKNYVSKKRERIVKALKAFKTNNKNLISDKFMDKAIKDGKNTFKIVLKKADLARFISSNSQNLNYVDLPKKIATKVAGAMVSTRIDPYAIDYGRDGSGIGIYIAELNCPDPFGGISNYTNLSSDTCNTSNGNCEHARNVISIARAVSPDSHIYCKRVSYGDVPTSSQRSNMHIESYSVGVSPTEDIDNIYKSWDRDLDNEAYDHSIAVFSATGNHALPPPNSNNWWNEDDTWNVSTPTKGFNTISIGNYNDLDNAINRGNETGDGHGGSAHRDPETGITKPEISAPGTLIAAGNETMTGTSQATPHAAGFAADLMGEYTWLQYKPYTLKAMLLSSSTKNITGDDSTSPVHYGNVGNRSGVGGLNFYNAYYGFYIYWWWGDFSYIASHDNGSDNNKLEVEFHQWSGNDVRIAISWLNDGDYTLNELEIGKDFNLYVYDPNGNMVGSSWSLNNSFEIVNFSTLKSGYYKVVIDLYSNNDTNAPTYISLSIN